MEKYHQSYDDCLRYAATDYSTTYYDDEAAPTELESSCIEDETCDITENQLDAFQEGERLTHDDFLKLANSIESASLSDVECLCAKQTALMQVVSEDVARDTRKLNPNDEDAVQMDAFLSQDIRKTRIPLLFLPGTSSHKDPRVSTMVSGLLKRQTFEKMAVKYLENVETFSGKVKFEDGRPMPFKRTLFSAFVSKIVPIEHWRGEAQGWKDLHVYRYMNLQRHLKKSNFLSLKKKIWAAKLFAITHRAGDEEGKDISNPYKFKLTRHPRDPTFERAAKSSVWHAGDLTPQNPGVLLVFEESQSPKLSRLLEMVVIISDKTPRKTLAGPNEISSSAIAGQSKRPLGRLEEADAVVLSSPKKIGNVRSEAVAKTDPPPKLHSIASTKKNRGIVDRNQVVWKVSACRSTGLRQIRR